MISNLEVSLVKFEYRVDGWGRFKEEECMLLVQDACVGITFLCILFRPCFSF